MNERDFWSGKRVFVTGATGFLGSWLVRVLRQRGALVIGLVRDLNSHKNSLAAADAKCNMVVHGQLEDQATLLRSINEYEVDTIFHVAAQPIVSVALQDPVGTFEVNVRGTWNLLDACRQYGKAQRIVVASSDKAYGHPEKLPYDETMALAGRAPYDVSKSCADLLARCYFETYGLPLCVTRAGNFYGGGDLNFSRIVPGTMRWALRGEQPILRSDGTMVRDYIYVRDVVEGYLAIAEAMERSDVRGEAFNLSAERPISVIDLTREILQACGRADLEPVILGQVKAEIQEQCLDATKARERVGWTCRWSLDAALVETAAWYKDYLATFGGL